VVAAARLLPGPGDELALVATRKGLVDAVHITAASSIQT
jgi:hypothetical protein